MQLSENFTLEELTHTDTGLPNSSGEVEKEKLLYLAVFVLQPLRDKWGGLNVASGYRSLPVNRAVGGGASSQHLKGEAADIIALDADLDEVFAWVVRSGKIPFGQCIRETVGIREWIHISLPRLDAANCQALVYDGKRYKPYI